MVQDTNLNNSISDSGYTSSSLSSEIIENIRLWPATKRGLEAGLFKISGNNIKYIIGYEDNFSDPEEKVRAELFSSLILDYEYPYNRIKMEVKSSDRRPLYPIDILIFEDDHKTIPFAVIECKHRNCTDKEFSDGIDQAFENANLMNSGVKCRPKFVMTYSLSTSVTWKYDDYIISKRNQYRVGDIPKRYGAPPAHKYLKEVDGRDKKPVDEQYLRTALKYCHQQIWHDTQKSSIFAFSEMVKIIYAALHDERTTAVSEPYGFQLVAGKSKEQIANEIKKLFHNAAISKRELFEEIVQSEGQDIKIIESIKISAEAIFKIVEKLESISFGNSDFDVKGSAFETIASPVFRGEYGGYFTPRVIVNFMVKAIDAISPIDINKEKFIDPACGSGGMLIALWDYAKKTIIPRLTHDPVNAEKLSGHFASKRLFGIEIVPDVAKVAMINMILRDDGSSNVELGSGVGPFNQYKNGAISSGIFDGVVTNPPFGDKITDKLSIEQSIGKEVLSKKKSVKSDAMFLLRSVELLDNGGRCAIVMPDSILNNPSDVPIRDIVRSKIEILGIISLPVETFMSSKASINTSIILFKKKSLFQEDSKSEQVHKNAEQQAKDEVNKLKNKEIAELELLIKSSVNETIAKGLKSRLSYIKKIKWKRILEDKIDEIYRTVSDYKIFIADADFVGIDATGKSIKNVLPEILKQFEFFLSNKHQYCGVNEKDYSTKSINFSHFTRWDSLYYREKYNNNISEIKELFGQIVPVSHCFDISYETFDKNNAKEESYNYVEISNIELTNGKILNVEEVLANDLPSRAKWIIRENDLLISTTRPYRGAIAIAEKCHDGFIATSGFLVLRPSRPVNVKAIMAFMKSTFGLLQMEQHMTGGAYPAIGTYEIMERIQLPVMSEKLAEDIDAKHLEIGEVGYTRKLDILAEMEKLEKRGEEISIAIRNLIYSK